MASSLAFTLRGDHITLDALLKACGVAGSGGEAKARVMIEGPNESAIREQAQGIADALVLACRS